MLKQSKKKLLRPSLALLLNQAFEQNNFFWCMCVCVKKFSHLTFREKRIMVVEFYTQLSSTKAASGGQNSFAILTSGDVL